MTTFAQALEVAQAFWQGKSGERVMSVRAETCCKLVGGTNWQAKKIEKLTIKDGTELLTLLSRKGLSRKTQADYYQTFRRMLKLNGTETITWPRPPIPPRKTRDPMQETDYQRMASWLLEHNFPETAWLTQLLTATGLRVGVELLRPDAVRVTGGDSYDTLHVRGKGGHEREVPVVCPVGRALLVDQERLAAVRRVPYKTHLWRWNRARQALGIKSRLATPHALRHKYATELWDKSGGNLVLVQEMLGHANPGTTAGYITTPMDQKAKALQ